MFLQLPAWAWNRSRTPLQVQGLEFGSIRHIYALSTCHQCCPCPWQPHQAVRGRRPGHAGAAPPPAAAAAAAAANLPDKTLGRAPDAPVHEVCVFRRATMNIIIFLKEYEGKVCLERCTWCCRTADVLFATFLAHFLRCSFSCPNLN